LGNDLKTGLRAGDRKESPTSIIEAGLLIRVVRSEKRRERKGIRLGKNW